MQNAASHLNNNILIHRCVYRHNWQFLHNINHWTYKYINRSKPVTQWPTHKRCWFAYKRSENRCVFFIQLKIHILNMLHNDYARTRNAIYVENSIYIDV